MESQEIKLDPQPVAASTFSVITFELIRFRLMLIHQHVISWDSGNCHNKIDSTLNVTSWFIGLMDEAAL